MSTVTIGKLRGRARGGGSEFLMALDMTYGAIGRARVSQIEAGVGVLAGGGGTQRLLQLMGRKNAMEALLGSGDYGAKEVERFGWITRALPNDELDGFVAEIAERIAAVPNAAVRFAKQSVIFAEGALEPGLAQENRLFHALLEEPGIREYAQKFLAAGGETYKGELEVMELIKKLATR